MKFIFLCLVSAGLFFVCLAQNTFEAEIKAFEKQDSISFPPKGKILLVGSSSIRLWESYQTDLQGFTIIKRGFGGSQTSDLLYFCHRIITPYQPKQIFVYEGDNDIGAGKSPQQVLADFTALVKAIREKLPESQIFFIAIKPSPSRLNLLSKQKEANQLIKNFCTKQKKMKFLDVFSPMLNAKGEPDEKYFIEDKLHMNKQGYAVWAKVLRKVMRN